MEFIIEKTKNYQDAALKMNNLDTALKLMWLRRTLSEGTRLDDDQAVEQVISVARKGTYKWPV